MIIECIVTTLDAAGVPNFAPMGVEWGEDEIVIKPFLETTTFRNLQVNGAAVANITDDVLPFAQSAIATVQFPAVPAAVVRGVVLAGACSWRELEVRAIDATPPRARVVTRVVHRGTLREFLGFNRARHAVLEAAILATRTHLLPAEQIRAEFARLQVIVDKTAGPREREAMAIERQADDIARCFLLERLLSGSGWETVFEGEVVGLVGSGAFVAFGPDRSFEGMLPVRRIHGDWWELNEEGTILVGVRRGGAIRLGDPVKVRVERVDAPRGRVDLLPAWGED